MKKIKVRFNLSKGEYFMKWKVSFPSGSIVYFNPEEIQLIMYDCELKNNKKTAKKIFDGENKSVCAWVSCSSIEILSEKTSIKNLKPIKYNPKISPCWVFENKDYDEGRFEKIITEKNNLYV